MMETDLETLRYEEIGPGIGLVVLNRPKSLNALSVDLLEALRDTFRRLSRERRIRAVVLTGAGRGFCSGLDVSLFTKPKQAPSTPEGAGDGKPGRVQSSLYGQKYISDLIREVRRLPQPLIAAVNGPAAGGGLALALACDTRVCGESAKFSAAFVHHGLSGCDVGVSYLLPRVVGPTLAFEMMLTGRNVDAAEAYHGGLVLGVVPDADVVAAAVEIAERVVSNSPFGVEMTKEVMWANLSAGSLESAMALEDRTQALCGMTADASEATRAFAERRPAVFRNQ